MTALNLEDLWGSEVIGLYVEPNRDCAPTKGEILADEVILDVGASQLRFTPLIDSDEIRLDLLSTAEVNTSNLVSILHNYLGRKLSMVWTCKNFNGYLDIIVLSFDNLQPNLVILSDGSVLKLFTVSPVMKPV